MNLSIEIQIYTIMNNRLLLLTESLTPREQRLWQSIGKSMLDRKDESWEGISKNAMAQREHRMLKGLLQELIHMHAESIPKLALLSSLQEACILKEKGLYDHALSILGKVYQKAMESQQWHIMGEAAEELRQILSRKGDTDAVLDYLSESLSVLEHLEAEYRASEIAQTMFKELTITGNAPKNSALHNQALAALTQERKTLKVTYHARSALAMSATASGDHKERAEHHLQICRYMEDRPVLIESRPDIYTSALNNLCNAYQELGELQLIPETVVKIRAAADRMPMQQSVDRALFFAVRQEAELLGHQPEPRKIEPIDAEARQMLSRWEQTIHPSNLIELCLILATASFRTGNNRKTLFWLNRLDSLTGRKLRKDMQCASLALRLMTYMQSGDLELAQTLTRTRTFKKLQPSDSALKPLREVVKHLISLQQGKEVQASRSIAIALEDCSLSPWIDVKEWIKGKLHN
jgi:hypothetical protein